MLLAQELLAFGMSNKEAEVYIAALQLGYASVQEISEKALINRTSAYTYIKNMICRGLINAVERNGKIYYVAEKPEKLKYIYEREENEIRRKRELLEQILPELDCIYNLAKEKPSVKYYENNSDLEKIRAEILNVRALEILNIFNYQQFNKYINKRYIQSLIDSTEKFRVLYVANNKIVDPRIMPFLENEKFRMKYLSSERFGFLCEILIVGNNVYIAREKDCLLIDDALFSQTLALLFQALWGLAESI
ncbi:hypothetical protein KKC32_03500 [Patescibacteria group bacterium]|nr:hypothetical protein [Patescibacteria group bacterium]